MPKMLEEGVLYSYKEHAEVKNAFRALAALRDATSFQNTTPTEVKQ